MNHEELIKTLAAETGIDTGAVSEFVKTLHYRAEETPNWKEFNDVYLERIRPLFQPGLKFNKIAFETDKGRFEFNAPDPFMKYFISPLDRIRWHVRKKEKQFDTAARKFQGEILLFDILEFFEPFGLTEYTRGVAIGRCLAHFKIFAGRSAVMSEQQWTMNPTQDRSYKNYLNSRVKSLLKNYNPKFFYQLQKILYG